MKLILFGSNGMLGSYLKSYLSNKYDILPLTRKDIDLANVSESELLIFLQNNVKKDDIVVNAAGVIKQREYDAKDMIIVNAIFPNILAKFKDKIGCEIIHITTDCVYSGNKGLYDESSLHDCTDDYGKSKSLGENIKLTNIRTSIIGEEKLNKKSLLEWLRSNKNKTINGYDNHLWNGITCLELCKLVNEIIKTNSYWHGIRHVFSPNTVSKYELTNMINEIYDLNIKINKVTTNINCYRNLSSKFPKLITKTLYEQILELKNYSDHNIV